ncbi:hypothetical protein AMJ85_02060 [candidate division BRC1 bacterium SM23_51]|nr:MAG: hypothetical protein AMJ85_02060 [candidate division BRC1 bacterium SM23_51]
MQTPDLNLDGTLQPTEDFPLDGYPHPDGVRTVYSRPVTQALASNNVFGGPWPPDVATPAVANTYWDIREAVRLYDEATSRIPSLEAMILAGVRDHVQSAPFKPHIRQALEGWRNNGAWVQLNPSPTYLIEADPILAGRSDLPDNVPNTLPGDWTRISPHCVPKDINSSIYQLASIRQMADRVEGVLRPAPAGADLITFVNSAGVGRIAVRIEVPERPRYPEGAPIVVEVSTWFVNIIDFHRVNETTRIGAITISYLWPEGVDRDSGARSEGVYDYGGPDSLAVLRDVIRFASGQIPDVDGRTIEDLVAVTALTENVGLFASSHSGVVATNVLAHHGGEMPLVKYLVGRENPTRDEMYPLELGHFDNRIRQPFHTHPSPGDLSEDVGQTILLPCHYAGTVGQWRPDDGELAGRSGQLHGDTCALALSHDRAQLSAAYRLRAESEGDARLWQKGPRPGGRDQAAHPPGLGRLHLGRRDMGACESRPRLLSFGQSFLWKRLSRQ